MNATLMILGAGPLEEDGAAFGSAQNSRRRRLMDWQLSAFRNVFPRGHCVYVGGSDVTPILGAFPDVTVAINPLWQETGPTYSLCAGLETLNGFEPPDLLFVLYGDVLLRPEMFQHVVECATDTICVVTDATCPSGGLQGKKVERFGSDPAHGNEFVGFVCVPRALFSEFRSLSETLGDGLRASGLSALLSQMHGDPGAPKVTEIDGRGHWGHGEDSRSIARFVLGSKAGTLARLHGKLKHTRILPLESFTYASWRASRDQILQDISTRFADEEHLVIRSSALDEDGFATANAGKYDSELGIPIVAHLIGAAVDRVFASYGNTRDGDEVLVQPQLTNVAASGVLFTRQLGTGAPYYIVNYAVGDDTAAITGGAQISDVTVSVSRNLDEHNFADLPAGVADLLRSAREIERVVMHDSLDIEFAILTDGEIIGLQVRPLMLDDFLADRRWDDLVEEQQKAIVARIERRTRQQGIVGDDPIWSVMADWNPAEIVGVQPGALALDLYRYVITDSTWALQRHEVGYRDVRNMPLVHDFAGHAYVDVRASINSFVPCELPDDVAAKLVNFSLDRLRERPACHDKIEFDIVPTCLDFDFDRWESLLSARESLSGSEIRALRSGLREVTNNIIKRAPSDLNAAIAMDALYDNFIPECRKSGVQGVALLLDACRDNSALAFAHLARAGFVAVSLLQTAVSKGLLTEARRHELMASIETISTSLRQDAFRVQDGTLSFEALVARYGHVRPGTYDITVPCYRADPQLYFAPMVNSAEPVVVPNFAFTSEEADAISSSLQNLGLDLDANGLLEFAHQAIEGREYSKFVFTRLISEALEIIREDQLRCNVDDADIGHVALDAFLDKRKSTWSERITRSTMARQIAIRKECREVGRRVLMPPILLNGQQISAFLQPDVIANFVTDGRIEAELIVLRTSEIGAAISLDGKIVAIPSADPGYDFLFGMGIVGLVTAFGGPNSHMAIRAAEARLPAAIGIGLQAFNGLSSGNRATLDCAGRRFNAQEAHQL